MGNTSQALSSPSTRGKRKECAQSLSTKEAVKNLPLFFLALGNLILLPLVSSANGLVPCGPGTDKPVCEFCDFFVMFRRIIDFVLFQIVPPLAGLIIAIGGFLLISAYTGITEGGPQSLNRAKALFKAVVIGLFIIYGAWIIINMFLWTIGATIWEEGGHWWEIPSCP